MLSERLIDLSCDLGEATSPEERALETEIWTLITAANVACGGHTGDASSMEAAVERAQNHSVLLGAHPSYPDREFFGRKSMSISPAALRDSLVEQLQALSSIASANGVVLSHVKPHGALYNDAHADRDLADTIVDAIRTFDPTCAVVAASTSQLHAAGKDAGLLVVAEAFADRRYRADGQLVPRRQTNALLLDVDEAAEQAASLALSRLVTTEDGTPIEVEFSTLCVHGDMPNAVARLTAIRERLTRASFAFTHLARIA